MITLLANLVINSNEPKKYYIGDGNDLVVRIPADMTQFKNYTMGKTLIMGHNTFNQTGPLKGRKIIVLSHKDIFYTADPNVIFIKDINWEKVKDSETEYVVCGGTSVYEAAIPYAGKLRLTMTELYPVDTGEFIGDKLFPDFTKYGNWRLENQSATIKQNGCKTTRGFEVDEYFIAEYETID